MCVCGSSKVKSEKKEGGESSKRKRYAMHRCIALHLISFEKEKTIWFGRKRVIGRKTSIHNTRTLDTQDKEKKKSDWSKNKYT
jgi:hypothetical protein